MWLFYEGWRPVFLNRPLTMDDLQDVRQSANDDMLTITNNDTEIDLSLLSKHINCFDSPEFFVTSFLKSGLRITRKF